MRTIIFERKWARFGGPIWAALSAVGFHTAYVTDDGWAIMLDVRRYS